MFTMTNIKNVYDEVQLFFDEELEWDSAIKREWVEGFLRQKAWQGANDQVLRDMWHNLKMFVAYLAYSGDMTIDDMTAAEYSLAVEWMIVQSEGFKPNIKMVNRLFDVLRDFYNYLATKKIYFDTTELELAAKFMTGSKRLKFIELGDEESLLPLKSALAVPKDIGRIVGEAVERLMIKFSS
jgi:site-specific recombinase XerD